MLRSPIKASALTASKLRMAGAVRSIAAHYKGRSGLDGVRYSTDTGWQARRPCCGSQPCYEAFPMNALLKSGLTVTLALAALFTQAHATETKGDLAGKNVVLVHGAFADGSSWEKVIPLLEARGLHVVAVQNPLSSLADEAAATKRAIDAQNGPVVLVGHSWGGAVISQAGNDDKVKALVYVAAFAPQKDQSINDILKGKPAPEWASALQKDSAGYLTLSTDAIIHDFAQDLPIAQARLVAATQGPWFAG